MTCSNCGGTGRSNSYRQYYNTYNNQYYLSYSMGSCTACHGYNLTTKEYQNNVKLIYSFYTRIRNCICHS